jgi:hypothetical protein
MSITDKHIHAILNLHDCISLILKQYDSDEDNGFKSILIQAKIENPWFTEENVKTALINWSRALAPLEVEKWVSMYSGKLKNISSIKTIGVVNAGNIPFVGLHDLLCVLLCDFNYTGKNATGDTFLLPFISSLLIESEPSLREKIKYVQRLEQMDAVIATGNNNSSRYFEYYFGKYPHVIRKNRNGVGVLTGNESNEQLNKLGLDIFTYFGLGCRSVSKLYVPEGYDFKLFFESIYSFNSSMSHSKYMNNFDYYNSILLLKQIPFLQNGFLIIRKEKHIASPVAVLHFEEYKSQNELEKNLESKIEEIQCIATIENYNFNSKSLSKLKVDFGKTQSPSLWDYADGVDIVEFLLSKS